MKVPPTENKFTLRNFDKWLGAALVKRGKQYFENGAVTDLDDDAGQWTAAVEGSEIYEVSVTLKDDEEIADNFCDCPFEEDVCKHQIAVLFAIREQLPVLKNVTKKTKGKPFDRLLENITAQEYSAFVKQYSVKNRDFKLAFEIFFADKDDSTNAGERYKKLIENLIKKFSDHGFLDYRSSASLAREINGLTGDARKMMSAKNYIDAFNLGVVIMKEMMEVASSSDDSHGEIGGTLYGVTELLNDIAESTEAAIDIKERLFAYLQKELNNKSYFDYGDFGYNLFGIFESLAFLLNKRQAYLEFIDARLAEPKEKYSDYRHNCFKTQKIDFLQATGDESAVRSLIQESLDIKQVRQGEINKAIARQDFEGAKALITGGIKLAQEKKHPGTVSDWEKELLRIAVLENDIPVVRNYSKHFAFDRDFSVQYYKQWKNTFGVDEWPKVLEKLIIDTTQRVTKDYGKHNWLSLNSLFLNSLAPIFIEEGLIDRLWDLVKNENDLDKIMAYQNHLISGYSAELLKLYLPALERKGDNASSRSDYAYLAKNMKKIIEDIPAGKEKVIAVARRLKEKYPRRPAMIDELNSILR
jgi:hypothetical protein